MSCENEYLSDRITISSLKSVATLYLLLCLLHKVLGGLIQQISNSWLFSLTQSILKEISPGISLEGMMLKLKLQYFGHLMQKVDSLEKTDAGRDWGQEEKGTTEDEMAGWHH